MSKGHEDQNLKSKKFFKKENKKSTFSMEYTPPQTHVDKQRDIVLTIPATFKYV